MTGFDWPILAILAIAAARAVRLVADDDVPFGPLRTWALKRFPGYGYGLGCHFCLSIWAGFFASMMATWQAWVPVNGWSDWPLFMVVWFAIAEAIILVEGLVEFLMGDD